MYNYMMKRSILLVLYFGLTCFQAVSGEHEHEIKRGVYPFMAIIYYSDPSVTDPTGERFVRTGVIIRADWLVTSAMGQIFINPTNGFPRKTLLARAGAIAIDANFTLNEDEDEQEREVIQIVRPYNHSATQWWTTDISLMKVLFPFNTTQAVKVKTLNMKYAFKARTCQILVYAKRPDNKTDDKSLMRLYVDLLSPSIENCGSHFAESTMVCASDSIESKSPTHDEDFCHGNSGGPLICEKEVMGLQTYIDNDCKQPHLYQLLSAWKTLITCGIKDKCKEKECNDICDITYKDVLPTDTLTTSPEQKTVESTTLSLTDDEMRPKLRNTAQEPTNTSALTSTNAILYIDTTKPRIINIFLTEDDSEISEDISPTTAPDRYTTSTVSAEMEVKSWPIEATASQPRTNESKLMEENDERKAHIAAQQHAIIVPRSDSTRNMCIIHTLFFGLLVLVCL